MIGLGLVTALYGGLAGWLVRRRRVIDALPLGEPARPGPLTERDRLRAVAERVLPGLAGRARVAEYIERTLNSPFWARRRAGFQAGLEVLDQVARDGWQQPFAGLSPVDQDEVLTHVQNGGADTGSFDGAAWVHDLVVLSLEGFLGDPRHGGNYEQLGWRTIGFIPGCPRHR